jgi:hypothetical protein
MLLRQVKPHSVPSLSLSSPQGEPCPEVDCILTLKCMSINSIQQSLEAVQELLRQKRVLREQEQLEKRLGGRGSKSLLCHRRVGAGHEGCRSSAFSQAWWLMGHLSGHLWSPLCVDCG